MRKSVRRKPVFEILPDVSSAFLSEFSTLVESFHGFCGEYLKAEVLSKYVGPDTDSADVRRQRAISKWLAVEQQNATTNRRTWMSEAKFSFGYSTQILLRASKIVLNTIGATPQQDLLFGSFSNGASTSKRLGPGVIARKFMEQADVTAACWKHVKDVVLACETWRLHSDDFGMTPNFVRGNVMFTVPKTAVIDRVACKEPDLNMFAQRGVGDFFRRSLRRKGIDLNNQSINRKLAEFGSRTGKLATIDLSSASDTVTTSVVALLLPPAWFKLLDDLRCRETCIDGVWHENHMFSSMGNGFTFELESLIFWALAVATNQILNKSTKRFVDKREVGETISVYGDDIIVPAYLAPKLYQVLSYFGFKVNTKKSFYEGGFRESCGGHYFDGADVTPFYIKAPIRDVSDLILVLNKLRAWSIRTGYDYHYPSIFAFWQKWSRLIPPSLFGGYDVESKVQLVSPNDPICVLQRKIIRLHELEGELQRGLYLASLRSIHDRFTPIMPKVQEFLCKEGSWRLRRVRDDRSVFGLVSPMFWQEQE